MFKTAAALVLYTVMFNIIMISYLFSDDSPRNSLTIEIPLPERDSLQYQHWSKTDREVICMAENIFHEARNQTIMGMQAVAFVTLNRVDHADYPDTVCYVLYDPFQFSWTLEDVFVNHNNVIEQVAWETSLQVAFNVMNSYTYNGMYGVTHYHRSDIKPIWSNNKSIAAVIDDHIFYVSN